MRNSSGWLTFDLSCVIELLNFLELYKKFSTKLENQADSKSWRVGAIGKVSTKVKQLAEAILEKQKIRGETFILGQR